MRCVGRKYRRVRFLIRITDLRSIGRGYTLRGWHFSALHDGGGFISTACEHHYVNVVVFRTGAAAVGLRTGLLEAWALDWNTPPVSTDSRMGHQWESAVRRLRVSDLLARDRMECSNGIDDLNLTGETIRLIDADGHGHAPPPAFDEPLRPQRIVCEALRCQSARMAVTGFGHDSLQQSA